MWDYQSVVVAAVARARTCGNHQSNLERLLPSSEELAAHIPKACPGPYQIVLSPVVVQRFIEGGYSRPTANVFYSTN